MLLNVNEGVRPSLGGRKVPWGIGVHACFHPADGIARHEHCTDRVQRGGLALDFADVVPLVHDPGQPDHLWVGDRERLGSGRECTPR
jgi:hypothetical protein